MTEQNMCGKKSTSREVYFTNKLSKTLSVTKQLPVNTNLHINCFWNGIWKCKS